MKSKESYVGSNPTPHTMNAPTYPFSDFEGFTRSRLLREVTLSRNYFIHQIETIRALKKRVNLWDMKAVQEYIDQTDWTNGRKERVSPAYSNWCETKGPEYRPKKYTREGNFRTYQLRGKRPVNWRVLRFEVWVIHLITEGDSVKTHCSISVDTRRLRS